MEEWTGVTLNIAVRRGNREKEERVKGREGQEKEKKEKEENVPAGRRTLRIYKKEVRKGRKEKAPSGKICTSYYVVETSFREVKN